MKTSLMDTAVLFFPFVVCMAIDSEKTYKSRIKERSSKVTDVFPGRLEPRFVSFDSDEGNIDINWDVSIPFVSIPLKHKDTEHEISPLLNINTKALAIAGAITTILAIIVPLFTKPQQEYHYRSDDNVEWSKVGNTINDLIFSNDYVTPCMQRIICTIVSAASRTDNPTSTEKIIDGLFSYEWFKNQMNGTAIHDAVTIGRESDKDCSVVYNGCRVRTRVFNSVMNQFGII